MPGRVCQQKSGASCRAFLFARIYHRGFQDTVTLEPVWPMRATVMSDAVFEQDRFERLRSFGDDLLLLL